LTSSSVKPQQGWIQTKDEGSSFMSFKWNKKFMVLEDRHLNLYKSDVSAVHVDSARKKELSMSVPLTTITNLTRVQLRSFCFELLRKNDKSFYVSVKTEDELYGWLDAMFAKCTFLHSSPAAYSVGSSSSAVSQPTNFTHKVHVGFDPASGAFIGLPDNWKRLLQHSHITNEDWSRDPVAVIEVLEFYSDINGASAQNSPNMPQVASLGHSSSSTAPPTRNGPHEAERAGSDVFGSKAPAENLTKTEDMYKPMRAAPPVPQGYKNLTPITPAATNHPTSIP
ncbi:hypothetical protein BABINDRAFT_18831, partial [Babjeviella inositovora NRRL Y-12698]